MFLRKSRFRVDKAALSWPEGAPKLRWEGWFGESEDIAVRSYSDGTEGFLREGDG